MLDGFCPSKLKDTFASASLSYSVSQLLFKKGRIEKFQIVVAFLADIKGLLHTPSWSGSSLKPENIYKAETEEQREFYEAVKEEFSQN